MATADLDVGGVRARLYNTGGLFWRGGDPVYEVPKDSGIQAIFAAGIWLGGTVDGELRFAGADYGDWEWWPGPLDSAGAPPEDCAAFDRIHLVTRQPDGALTGDVADWPADLGAPFEDLDGDGVYEPEAGETPTVYGHQTAFWVMNDRGNEHRWSSAEPLGLTARVTAHAFNADDPALGFGTFYRYTFENPNAYTIQNVRFGFWNDPDLGDFNDDYIGSDPERGMGFVYNGDNNDANILSNNEGTYGPQPPALGVDFLNGAEGMTTWFSDTTPVGNPSGGEDAYRFLNLLWRDDTPLTVGGFGYNPGSTDLTTWIYPGAPEQLAYWSESNTDDAGRANQPADRRYLLVAEPFELGPGATHTVDLALLWGRGVSFLDSVTEVREHSDRVQAAYDAGMLFAPGGAQTGPPDGAPPPLPAPTLATPVLTFPADGTDLRDIPDAALDLRDQFGGLCTDFQSFEECARVPLAWMPVPDAIYYEVQTARGPADFDDDAVGSLATTETFSAEAYTDNERVDVYWRVRARTSTELGPYSAPFRYETRFRYVPTFQGEGRGIVEIAYDGTPTCDADPTRSGCAEYDGATVWHTPSTEADYYVTADGGTGTIDRLNFRIQIAPPFDYEMRFTETCATDACWGVYTVFGGLVDTGLAVRVPFELWQVDPENPDGGVRMIPILSPGIVGRNDAGEPIRGEPGPTWNYGRFENAWDGSGFDGGADPDAPTSDVVYWMMPDRPDGYALFATDAAIAGPGGTITDSDMQGDLDPTSGEACRFQGFYIDFCHRNDEMPGLTSGARSFMAPVGRFQLADEARDGTPPPPGTTIRLLTTKPEPVANEDDDPLPRALTLTAYPNPTRGAATLAYALPESGPTTVTVYDVLGRRVAVLADGEEQAAGRHRAVLNTARLASGVYVAVLETAAGRQTQMLTVLR